MKRRARGTGTIEHRLQEDGSIKLYPRLPGRKRIGLGFYDDEDAANQALDEALKLHAAGRIRVPTHLCPFGEKVIEHRELDGYRNAHDEARTWKRYVSTWECATWPIEDVRRRHCAAWLRSLREKGLADQTRTNALNLLRAVFRAAVEDEIIDVNPCAELRIKRSGRTEETSTWLTIDELAALFWSADDEGRHLIAFAAGCGMREGEIFAAPPSKFHLEGSTPYVEVCFGKPGKPTKNGKIRRVPLFGIALAAARSWVSFWKVDDAGRHAVERDRFFFSTRTGRARRVGHPFPGKTHERWNARWDRWLRRAGITRNVRFHDLRHTCATLLLTGKLTAQPWSLEAVKEMLGHSSITVTERYAKATGSLALDAARGGPAASSIAAISCDLPTVSQLPTNDPLSARFWSRLRDLNSRPTVYEFAGIEHDLPIFQGVPCVAWPGRGARSALQGRAREVRVPFGHLDRRVPELIPYLWQ